MFFVPLSQIESIDLIIHALRISAGEADCTTCPVRKVCDKQCLTLAEGIQQLVATNSLPRIDSEAGPQGKDHSEEPKDSGPSAHLRIVK